MILHIMKVYQRNDHFDIDRIDESGISNLQRMKSGKALKGKDGNPIVLHHMIQSDDGALIELTRTMHQANTKVLHINPSSMKSGINRSEFNRWRIKYWKNRAKDFED